MRTIATGIVINNACSSWHRLAGDFTFGNARAYIGTLFEVLSAEAQEIVTRIVGRHYGKPLAHALWAAQREVYEDHLRRPYVVTGVFTQKLRVNRDINHMARVIGVMRHANKGWKTHLANTPDGEKYKKGYIQEAVAFYERELAYLEMMKSPSFRR